MNIETIVTAIIGGLFGGAITIIVAYIQSRNNLKRDYIKIAHELALEEYRTHFEILKERGGKMSPLESQMAYYTLFVQELKKKDFDLGKLEDFRKIHKELNRIYRDETNSTK